MSRIELLLALYQLALCPPEREHPEPLLKWLGQRQLLIDQLQRLGASALGACIERALAALVLHADRATYNRLVASKMQLGILMKRTRAYS